jgi:hypothetical protein
MTQSAGISIISKLRNYNLAGEIARRRKIAAREINGIDSGLAYIIVIYSENNARALEKRPHLRNEIKCGDIDQIQVRNVILPINLRHQ